MKKTLCLLLTLALVILTEACPDESIFHTVSLCPLPVYLLIMFGDINTITSHLFSLPILFVDLLSYKSIAAKVAVMAAGITGFEVMIAAQIVTSEPKNVRIGVANKAVFLILS